RVAGWRGGYAGAYSHGTPPVDSKARIIQTKLATLPANTVYRHGKALHCPVHAFITRSKPMIETYPSVLQLLTRRRSVSVKDMREPGPSPAQIEQLLAAALRVPDLGKLGPWRFILFQGAARDQFGEKLAQIYSQRYPDF